MTVPTDTIIRGQWFPTDVVLPGQLRPWNRCYTLVTELAVHVFRRVREDADWSSTIRWDTTTLPATERSARNGFDVWTDKGLVVITLGSGCSCGSLARWRGPTWARAERAR